MTAGEGFSVVAGVRFSKSTLNDSGFSPMLLGWLFDCHGFWHNVALILPSIIFLFYLAYQARRSFVKLLHGPSHIIVAYYGCLWLFSLLNFAWCCFQSWECDPKRAVAWNILSLFSSSGMLFLEVSLVAFLFQGNHASSLDSLTRTFAISGLVVGLDILLKVIYIFYFGIPLFIYDGETLHRIKWALLMVHTVVLTAIYCFILFMYHSKWREQLPARPAFYNYITIMFSLNALSLFSCMLSANGSGFGIWLHQLMGFCYHAFYLPLLYVTFLADFFQEDDMHLDNVYYSEMKDAGFFDADWE